jgi:adenosine deaminase
MRNWSTMPKVELHLHLEGAIPIPTLWELIERHGGDETIRTPAELVDWFTYRDFAHFMETWVWMIAFLQKYEDFTYAAEAVARNLASQNIVYAESFFSPSDFRHHHLEPQQLAVAIRAGLDRVPEVEVPLIVDLVRDRGPEGTARTLAAITEVAEEARVIGIGIGGHEAENPPEQFADVYRKAHDSGFRLTAHAGEAAGPESVWGAIRSLRVERIGHGVRAVEDPALVDYLVAHQIPLEVCPTSNIRTAVVPDWESHPARRLIAAGAMATINTDDPALFHASLAGEYQVLEERFGLEERDIRRISLAAVEACWAGPETKTRLADQLNAWWDAGDGSA